MEKKLMQKRAVGVEGFACIALMGTFFWYMTSRMGAINLINTFMNTAHDLLLNTVFFIMGIAVLAGAFASILSEFGVVAIINKILSPFMKPLYGLPGASALGIVTTYLSDNPAVITLANDEGFKKYFKRYQLPALTNLGTSFGMGLVVSAFMIAQSSVAGESLILPTVIGNIGAFIGSIVSVNIMIRFTKKTHMLPEEEELFEKAAGKKEVEMREVREGSVSGRLLEASLEGGKSGVKLGLDIIPGVLIICTLVMMLTNGATNGEYTGAAYEGVGLLPFLGDKISFILRPLFGFKNSAALAFPITSLGAVGAAISLVPQLLKEGIIGRNEIAVFTAMGMCWSGYLSTHVAMMDSLRFRELTGKAIFSHTIGGIVAGVSANLLFSLIG